MDLVLVYKLGVLCGILMGLSTYLTIDLLNQCIMKRRKSLTLKLFDRKFKADFVDFERMYKYDWNKTKKKLGGWYYL